MYRGNAGSYICLPIDSHDTVGTAANAAKDAARRAGLMSMAEFQPSSRHQGGCNWFAFTGRNNGAVYNDFHHWY
jgi:hypothetical protein